MNKILILLGCSVLLSAFAGCQGPSVGKSAVEVIVEGGGEFPPSLAGKWKSNGTFWQFVFEPNGMIASAVIQIGGVEMTPGKVTEVPTQYEGKGVFKPGRWLVQYSPDSRELLVEVVIEYFYQDISDAVLGGSTTDILVGPVSENGQFWRADWFSYAKLVAYIPEPNEFYNEPNEFYNDKEPRFRGVVTFEKVKQ
jgi:hypothetical protein